MSTTLGSSVRGGARVAAATSIALALIVLTSAANLTILRAQVAKATETPGETAHVLARAWTDEDQISSDATVRLWISIENNSAADLEGIAFDEFQTPGFARAECWTGETPACRNASNKPLLTLPTVQPGNRLVTRAVLKRDGSLPDGGKIVLTGLFHWTSKAAPSKAAPSAKKPDTRSSSLMTAAVSSPSIELLPTVWYKAPWLASVRDFSKDLLIPFAVLLGSLLFSFMLQKRAERQVILTEMLEKVTKDAERHLLPTSAAASRLIDEATRFHDEHTKALPANQPGVWTLHEKELLFLLVAFVKQTRHLKNTIGGFYLKLQSAEQVAAHAIGAFSDCQERRLGARAELDRVVAAVLPSVTYGSFEKRIKEAETSTVPTEMALLKDTQAVQAKLKGWLTREKFIEEEILALQLLTSILDVEIDRAFQRWYERAPHINRSLLRLNDKRCKRVWRRLHEQRDESYRDFQGLSAAIVDYRRDTARLAGPVWRPAFRVGRRISESWASWRLAR